MFKNNASFSALLARLPSASDDLKTITFLNIRHSSNFNQPKPKKRISSQQQKIDRIKREAEEKEGEQNNGSMQGDEYEEKDGQQHGLLQKSTPTATKAAA